jgi:glycosyltransferase A (GT-A) superfamily protein (DUF2064 family)
MHLLVMAKEPVAGRVKTRLCPPCTAAEAADLAGAALADTLEAVAACGADRRVIALEGRPGPWLPDGFEVVPQQGASLGERLDAAWAEVGGPGIQIGMDTPQVGADLLDHALARLADGASCLLGDAVDGGWWAIGLQRAVPRLFGPVPTSRHDTGARQRARCRALGLAVESLPVRRDVDEAADAVEVALEAPDSRFAAKVRALGALGRWDDEAVIA